jgi:hypothetical protein
MNEIPLKQILLIHPVRFTCSTIKEFAALGNVEVYFMEGKEEFTYLIDDLKPEIILIHHSFMSAEAEFVQAEVEKAQFKSSKLIILGEYEQAENLNAAVLAEPFSPQTFLADIRKYL